MKARIKGTDVIVECQGIGEILGNGGSGVRCKYLTGEHKGTIETIPGDCLVELNDHPNWKELRANMVMSFTVSSLVRLGGMPADEEVRRDIVDAAIEMADYVESRLKDKYD